MPKTLITHSETFHTDDVFATAMLLQLFPDSKVIRTRDEDIIKTGDIVYDVGKVYDPATERYDHHQQGAVKRDNGITYCGFGLLWQKYGVQYCGDNVEVAAMVDKELVQPMDANDNGQVISDAKFENVSEFSVDNIIKSYNPQFWVDNNETYDGQFAEAVELAGKVLQRYVAYCKDRLAGRDYLLRVYQASPDKRLLIADKEAPVSGIIESCPELLYVISPRQDSKWSILAVAVRPGDFACRRPFPEQWRAQDPADLARITGVSDAIFCHASGFLAVAGSKAGAISLVNLALGK